MWGMQNLFLAVGSIAVLALPMLLGSIPLWVAVACHEGSTLLVVLNSLRLLHTPSPPALSASLGQQQPSASQYTLSTVAISSNGAAGKEEKEITPCRAAHKIDPLCQLEGGGLAGACGATVTWNSAPAAA